MAWVNLNSKRSRLAACGRVRIYASVSWEVGPRERQVLDETIKGERTRSRPNPVFGSRGLDAAKRTSGLHLPSRYLAQLLHPDPGRIAAHATPLMRAS